MFKILFLLLCFSTAFAEVIDAPVNPIDFQQNPSSIDWRKIDTEHFELIFPAEVTEDAQRVAHLLEKVYPFVSRTQGLKRFLPVPLELLNRKSGLVTFRPDLAVTEDILDRILVIDHGFFQMAVVVKVESLKRERLFVGFVLQDIGRKEVVVKIKPRINDGDSR